MIVYISDPKKSTKELLLLINTYSNKAGKKINSEKSIAFLSQIINGLGMKSEKHHIRITTNNIKYLGLTPIKQVEDLYDKILNL